MWFFSPPNVEKLKDKRNVRGLIKALCYKDWEVRQSAAQALGEIADPQALEALIRTLQNDQQPNVRREVATALGKFGDAKAVKPLIAVLKDKDSNVRQTAVDALVALGEVSVAPLSNVLKSEQSWQVRQTAAEALQNLGWKPEEAFETGVVYWILTEQWDKCVEISRATIAIETLTNVLKSHPSSEIRQSAIKTLGKIRDPLAVEHLIEFLKKNQNSNVNQTVIETLINLGEFSVEPLSKMLKSEQSWQVRQTVAETLQKIGWNPENFSETAVVYWILTEQWDKCVEISRATIAIETLTNVLKSHPSLEILQSAIKTLGKIRDPLVAEPLIEAFKDYRLRDTAAEALVELNQLAVKPLSNLLKSDPSIEVRQYIVKILTQIGDTLAQDVLSTALREDNDIKVRLACYSAIQAIPDAHVEETDVKKLVDSTAQKIRYLYAKTRTEQVLKGYRTETYHTYKTETYTTQGNTLYCLSPRSVANDYDWHEETREVPYYETREVPYY